MPKTTVVERLTEFHGNDLADLCDAAETAIIGGGGFGWLKPPRRDVMEAYWKGVLLVPERQLFVGRLDGGPAGTFTTTYKFEAKLDADGAEVRGRCQHPIVSGSGTGGFAGASGRVDFKDIIGDPTFFVYRGHVSLR